MHFTAEHEWVRRTGDDTVRIGITDFAQSALGDVVFVQLPEVGTEVTAGESFGEVESTKSVSDLYAPVSGKVSAVNGELEGSPQLANSDPYGAGLADRRSGLGCRRVGVGYFGAARRRGLPRHTDRMTVANVPASPSHGDIVGHRMARGGRTSRGVGASRVIGSRSWQW